MPQSPLVTIADSAGWVALLRLVRPMLPRRRVQRAHTPAHQDAADEDVQNLPLGTQLFLRLSRVLPYDVARGHSTEPG